MGGGHAQGGGRGGGEIGDNRKGRGVRGGGGGSWGCMGGKGVAKSKPERELQRSPLMAFKSFMVLILPSILSMLIWEKRFPRRTIKGLLPSTETLKHLPLTFPSLKVEIGTKEEHSLGHRSRQPLHPISGTFGGGQRAQKFRETCRSS